MIDLSTKHFNAQVLTRDGGLVSGQLRVAVMSRLCQALHSVTPTWEDAAPQPANGQSAEAVVSDVESNFAWAQAEVRGGVDEQGQAYLLVAVGAEVPLVCQRCLQPMRQRLTAQSRLAIVRSDEEAAALPPGWEPLVVADLERVALAPIIEDELLLALPPYPHHDTGRCAQQAESPAQRSPTASDDRPHPFAELAKLRDVLKQRRE